MNYLTSPDNVRTSPPGESLPENPTILVVDDDPMTRTILRIALESHGYACIEAENGREGIEALASQQVDMVLSDHQMPVMTGMEFIHELRHCRKDLAPPVILMSGDPHDQLQQQAREMGVAAFFAKPFQLESLLHTMGLVISHHPVPVFSH